MAKWLLNGTGFGSLALSLALVVPPAHAQMTFRPFANYPTGQNPQYVAVADLNNDGAPDAVVVNNTSGTINVLLNKHDGTGAFNPPATYSVGSSPSWAAIADVNADGKPDIVVSNMTSGTISVLLNNGDGTFQAASSYTVLPAGVTGTPSPASVAIGDVNNDGKPDVVVANTGMNNVSVLLNNGTGTFKASAVYAVGTAPDSIAVAKFTSGANIDILTANKSGRNISVLLGNGDGTFKAAKNTPSGYVPYGAIATDIDGDGKMDVVVCDNVGQASGVNILKGNGDGTFQKAVLYSGGQSPIALAVGDFNGDGREDVATANTGSQDVSLFLNAGSATFDAPSTLAAGATHLGIGVGDFDGDGSQDILLANTPSGVTVLLNVTASLTNFLIAPNTLLTGGSTVARVTLSRPAQPGGVLITLANDSPKIAWAPDTLLIAEGEKTGFFHVSTTAPNSGTVTITASCGGIDIPATLIVNPVPSGPLKADVNGDGKVDVQDIVAVARIVAGLDVMK